MEGGVEGGTRAAQPGRGQLSFLLFPPHPPSLPFSPPPPPSPPPSTLTFFFSTPPFFFASSSSPSFSAPSLTRFPPSFPPLPLHKPLEFVPLQTHPGGIEVPNEGGEEGGREEEVGVGVPGLHGPGRRGGREGGREGGKGR